MEISKIDRNFAATEVIEDGFAFRNVSAEPFSLEGLAWRQENEAAGRLYYRLPAHFTTKDASRDVIEGIANQTAGVCVRFRSDSPELTLRATLAYGCDMNHMPRTGSCGFDSYCRQPGDSRIVYHRSIQPDRDQAEITSLFGINSTGQLCDWQVNFPLYGGVSKVEIGVKPGSQLLPPTPHRVGRPLVFYGSSITQGGCASRPGNAYTTMLCRRLDAEQINLGFSGNGLGEPSVARAIAKLKMAAFVMDYDYNAPTPEHLEATHEKFFQIIRQEQPELPIIVLSKCDFYNDNCGGSALRREIIRKTCRHAVDAGDEKVYFIDGETLFAGPLRDDCTVDRCHPNDLGFYRMHEHILPVLCQALGLQMPPE